VEHPFLWYDILPAVLRLVPQHTLTALFISALLVVVAYLARRALVRARDAVVPDGGFSLRNAAELLVELILGLTDALLGKKGRKYLPFFGSFFIFILSANLFGLVPGFSPPTNNLNTTLGLGLVSFIAYHSFGFREHGAGYLKQFMGPVLLLAPFFFVLEGISHLVRPFSLALRLFGNMFGDHLVVEIFTELTKVVIPVLFYMLGALVSLIQAFVFTLLSVIYVAMAISHEH
jgi:F-type H+-transporting ATPase subunit a